MAGFYWLLDLRKPPAIAGGTNCFFKTFMYFFHNELGKRGLIHFRVAFVRTRRHRKKRSTLNEGIFFNIFSDLKRGSRIGFFDIKNGALVD